MAYLSKNLILKAYKALSSLTDDHKQGQTQITSAIRHLFALDMFYKQKNLDCDLNKSDDKDLFVDNVRKIVNIKDNYYTTNFYTTIKPIDDCGVGSNFTSVGVVNNSKQNTQQLYEYPTRGQFPLFNVRNAVAIRNVNYYKNIKHYLCTENIRAAFVIWVLRNDFITDLTIEQLKRKLHSYFTEELLENFLPKDESLQSFIENSNISDAKYTTECNDLMSLFTSNIATGTKVDDRNVAYTTALRTKPFLLLAGISGTGKSQKVQELAFMTCPEGELRDPKSTTPGNYQLVEVKPNWHDSTELLGYYSALSGKYELTDFIRFTYKALQNKDVPFFLCLDEMNLAPVEQYFAEFLSVLETRKKVGDNIETQPMLTKEKFSNCEISKKILKERQGYVLDAEDEYEEVSLYSEEDAEIVLFLKENGLHLPDNLFVIGTVNMDDTTHQFSRKVIDRAFTIEMNGGKMADMFAPASKTLLEYREKPVSLAAFKSRFVRAYEVLDDSDFSKYADIIKERIPALLGDSDGTAKDNYPESINGILNDTPFRVSYRVQNELVLYLSVLIENAEFPEDEKKIESLISEAVLAILLEKVLPRVQGEKKQLETKDGKSNILKDLKGFIEKFKSTPDENDEISSDSLYMKVIKKLEEMDGKLSGYYTNFF